MSAPKGSGPTRPTAFVATFNYIAADEKTNENFKAIMEMAFKLAVNKVLEAFGSDIEIVEPEPEQPATEVMDRDDV